MQFVVHPSPCEVSSAEGDQVPRPWLETDHERSNWVATGSGPSPNGLGEVDPSASTMDWKETTGAAPEVTSIVLFHRKADPSCVRNLTFARPPAATPLPCIASSHIEVDPCSIVIGSVSDMLLQPPGSDRIWGVKDMSLFP